jgi:integrase
MANRPRSGATPSVITSSRWKRPRRFWLPVPDTEWKLIFALCRFGGLRCPTEVLRLSWADINWAGSRFTVHASNTEHHEDAGIRVVPIFPQLRPYLQDCFDLAEPGAMDVITRYRDNTSNLRTQLGRIIKKAGLVPWPKPFQNLRATRETELSEQFPIHAGSKRIKKRISTRPNGAHGRKWSHRTGRGRHAGK